MVRELLAFTTYFLLDSKTHVTNELLIEFRRFPDALTYFFTHSRVKTG